jgi:hypothetical protein
MEPNLRLWLLQMCPVTRPCVASNSPNLNNSLDSTSHRRFAISDGQATFDMSTHCSIKSTAENVCFGSFASNRPAALGSGWRELASLVGACQGGPDESNIARKLVVR